MSALAVMAVLVETAGQASEMALFSPAWWAELAVLVAAGLLVWWVQLLGRRRDRQELLDEHRRHAQERRGKARNKRKVIS